MGLWDVIKRSFQRETTKAAVKASAAAVASAAETAADGLLSEAEAELAQAEKAREEREDAVVLPTGSVEDPAWLAEMRKTEASVREAGFGRAEESNAPESDEKALAELAALKAQLLNIEE